MPRPPQEDLPEFLAKHRVQVIASLPCYLESNVDKQRGDQASRSSCRFMFAALTMRGCCVRLCMCCVYCLDACAVCSCVRVCVRVWRVRACVCVVLCCVCLFVCVPCV